MRRDIRFLRRGQEVRLSLARPTETLLDYLRLTERSTGTKEGCAEGDCGACTVVLRRLRGGRLVYEPVDSCILLTAQIDGCELITIEDLAADGALHPIQQAILAHHGSQCGFCTPGMVMSLFALAHGGQPVTREAVQAQISGNLCRCTGYLPIVAAGLEACNTAATDRFVAEEADIAKRLAALDDGEDILIGDDGAFFAAPTSLAALADLYGRHPDATLIGGATDVGLWITKELRELPKLIWLGRVKGLAGIEDRGASLHIGAATTFAAAEAAMAALDADLGELWRRIGGKQIRNLGTIGGNIANGSSIADTPPALIALGATLELQQRDGMRRLPLEAFFTGFKRQDRRAGEFLRAVEVPKLGADERFRAFKISKREEQDLSSVMMAIKVRLDGARIVEARIGFGGVTEYPKRALRCEAALIGARLDDRASWVAALDALADDLAPSDPTRVPAGYRGSPTYRRRVARNLIEKALLEIAGQPTTTTRIVGRREVAHAVR